MRGLVLAALLAAAGAAAAEDVRIVDDAGLPVVLAHPAHRIVTLAPHLTLSLIHI